MSVIALLLLVALLIPIMGIVVDSPIGRALARRLEGGTREVPPALDDLAKKVDLLEAEVDAYSAVGLFGDAGAPDITGRYDRELIAGVYDEAGEVIWPD